jgi:hypothetical protein
MQAEQQKTGTKAINEDHCLREKNKISVFIKVNKDK